MIKYHPWVYGPARESIRFWRGQLVAKVNPGKEHMMIDRVQIARKWWIDLMSSFGVGQDDAIIILDTYLKEKIVKLTPLNRYQVIHGAFLDKEVLEKTLKDEKGKPKQ